MTCRNAALMVMLPLFAACAGKPSAPAWTLLAAPPGEARAVYLDTANVVVNAGVIYVTLLTRKAGETAEAKGLPFGLIHAEANCTAHRIDPTALKEEQYGADGGRLGMQLVSLSAQQTEDVLARACSIR